MANEHDEKGCVLWLPDKANDLDVKTWKLSGLNDGARDHPVLIMKVYDYQPQKYYVVLVCTGTYKPELGDLPISQHSPDYVVYCSECRSLKPDVQVLHYDSSAKQPKHTHVKTQQAYLVSDLMVREQRETASKQYYKLDEKSFRIVKEKSAAVVQNLLNRPRVKTFLEELLCSQQDSVPGTTSSSSSAQQSSPPAPAAAPQPATDVAPKMPVSTEPSSSSPSESSKNPEQTESKTTSAITPESFTESSAPTSVSPPSNLAPDEYDPYDEYDDDDMFGDCELM